MAAAFIAWPESVAVLIAMVPPDLPDGAIRQAPVPGNVRERLSFAMASDDVETDRHGDGLRHGDPPAIIEIRLDQDSIKFNSY
jgi:hypothetical protein